MPSLAQGFRRVSASEIFRRSSKSDAVQQSETLQWKRRASVPLQKAVVEVQKLEIGQRQTDSDTRPPIFGLPAELHALVLTHVSFEDLCALRLVSRDVKQLLDEGDIVRKWVYNHLDELERRLYPPPKPVTFIYLLEQRRRSNSATDLSELVARYIEHDVLSYNLRTNEDHELFHPVGRLICAKLRPTLLTTQHYLEKLKRGMLAPGPDGLDEAQKDLARIECYTDDELLAAHRFWLFMAWAINQCLKNPSYASAVERAMKGWYASPPDPNDLCHYLALGNIKAFSQLLQLKTNRERRKAIDESRRRLNPDESVQWQKNWAALGPEWDHWPTKAQVHSALQGQLSFEGMWAASARNVLIERGLIDMDGSKGVGTPAQALEFLNDISGYDVLHATPHAAMTGTD